MAKHCDVCNNSYPDSEDHCPHCAAAKVAGAEEVVDLGEPYIAEVSEASAEALPEPGPDSGESVVSWSALVEDAGSVPAGESPSAVDLGQPFVAEIASGSELPGATVTETPAAASESAVGGEPLVAEVASSDHLSSEPFVAEVASSDNLAGGAFVAEVADEEDPSSAIDLGALASRPNETQHPGPGEMPFPDDVAEEVEAGSSVNLGAAVRPTDRPSSRDLIAEAVESGVDLGSDDGTAAAVGEAEPEDVEAVESAVDLGEAEAAEPSPSSAPEAVPERRVPPGSHSDIDLDSESEAEIDLAHGSQEDAEAAEAEDSPPGSSGVDLGGVAGRPSKRGPLDDSSSAIDMGGPAPAEVAEDEEEAAAATDEDAEEATSSAKKVRKIAAEEDDEDAAAALLTGGAAAEADEEEAVPTSSRRKAAAEVEDEEEAAVPSKADEEDEDEAPAAKSKKRAASEDEDEEEPKTKKPPKARSGCGCLVLGGVLGLLVGAAAPIALSMFNVVDPAKEVGELVGIKPEKANPKTGPGNPNPDGQKPAQGGGPAPAPVDAGQQLKSGDFAAALKAMEGAGAAPANDQAQADRGTARWMSYLQDQMNKGDKPKADDEAVKKAREDLQAAADKDNPEAILALGNLQEFTAGPAEALKTYQAGLKKFEGKPGGWARVFQAQINRLDSTTARPADLGKPQAAAPRSDDGDVSARALALLLIAFQAPGGDAPTDKGPEEAGFDFWAAVKTAQSGKYAEAIAELDAARKAHDKLRFSRLRKAQNPLSDPTEEIFLRAADEIKAYWTLQNSLAKNGIAARTPAEAEKSLEALAKPAAELKDIAAKLKTTPDKVAAGIDALVKERDAAAKEAMTLKTDLATAKKDADAAKKEAKDTGDKLALAETQLKATGDKLKAVNDRLEAAGVKGADAAKGIDALAAERAAADKAIDAVVAKVNTAHIKVDRKDVLKGVDRVVEAALVSDPKGELMASRDELRRMGAALAQRHSPEQMLDIWIPVLADHRGLGSEPAMATVDAARVRDDDRATAVAKKKAAAVLGLAKRDEGDVVAARTLLSEAVGAPGAKAPWQETAAKALQELTDPNAYYLPRARFFHENGMDKESLAVLGQADTLFQGKDAAALLALRSLVRLDEAREKGKGKVGANDPLIADAKKDAQAAADAGNADGHYALGRVNEELGNLAEAKAAYAKALAAHDDNDEAGARYRLALARVLKLQGQKPAGPRAALDMRRQPLVTLALLVEVGLQPGAAADEDQATKLLKEVENAKDGPDTFMLKAQALALRGLWTAALKTYAVGLRPHVRRDYADGLIDLIDRTPALRRPSAMDPPNPLLADASYAAGLRHYFARRYADAETSFLKAVEYDNQDARYYYFLGLSRLALDKTGEAADDFREGAQLETLNRPGREAVSSALERVQGSARQAVNRARP